MSLAQIVVTEGEILKTKYSTHSHRLVFAIKHQCELYILTAINTPTGAVYDECYTEGDLPSLMYSFEYNY